MSRSHSSAVSAPSTTIRVTFGAAVVTWWTGLPFTSGWSTR
ncbi:MAG: hypothetical protein R3C15_00435 [Thermoleophilia bacterium]